ncbi:MAG: LegC family aminotransferase [Flavobacteriales bacterium]|nr:LegC family aminotransferase [Flavobacteriales bacterium]
MIPLSVPNLSGKEWEYIKECLDTNWVSSVGSFVDRFESEFAEHVGSKHAISVVNGTSALHISLQLSGVQQHDYVIVPNITFIASLNSIKYCGAKPILVDIDPNTWQMDLVLLRKFLEEKTHQKSGNCYLKSDNKKVTAVMPVHVLGNLCNMNKLMQIAKEFSLKVIEDSTESLGSYFENQHSGTFGGFGCFSFNGNKIMTTGGGGMIVTNDADLAQKAKHITTQAKSDKFEYIHDEIGYNYRLVNVLAAMGVAQLEQVPDFIKAKQKIAKKYKAGLQNIDGISFQTVESGVIANNWLFTISSSKQKELIEHLLNSDIQVRPLWKPMNQLEMFVNDLYVTEKDISNKIYANCISLPCSTNLGGQEQDFVIKKIKEFYS